MAQNDPTACKLSAVANARKPIHGQLAAGAGTIRLLVAAACLFGGSGMLAWLAFLLLGPICDVDLGLDRSGRLFLDAGLCLLFFAQHSIMVRRGFRLWLARRLDAGLHGVLYASGSGLALLALVTLWQPVDAVLWDPGTGVRWLMTIVFALAGAGAWWGARALGDFDALGIKPAMRTLQKRDPAQPLPFTVRGPYRWVRHPLYLFSLVMVWSGPVFTPDRLLHNGLWTIWIAVAAAMEERDLARCYGDAYQAYRRAVPMLIPRGVTPRVAQFRQPMSNDH